MSDSVLIVGRGKSAYSFDWSGVDCPILAVSSGIFALPRDVKCDHFVTLDEPKNFMAQLMAHAPHAWQHDEQCRYWPFWADASIVKHVINARIRTIRHNPIPVRDILDSIKEWCLRVRRPHEFGMIRDAFYSELGDVVGNFGLQPGWGDYQNVRGWNVKPLRYPKWFGDGPLAVLKSRHEDGMLFNSLLMAVQVATRLGFKTIKFIGVDLVDVGYGDSLVEAMRSWHKHAVRRGITWVNLAPESRLSSFVSSPSAEVVSGIDLGEIARMAFGDRKTRVVPFCEGGVCGFDIEAVA
jgi:hypothetical protein